MKHITIDEKLHEEFKNYCDKNCIIMSRIASKLIHEWLLEQNKCQLGPQVDTTNN